MSFGASPGDIVTAATLALRAYRACKAAAGEFAEVTREVSAVSILVQDLEDQAANLDHIQYRPDPGKQVKLRSIIDGIIYALRELEELATKYSSLSTAKKNNWDRLRFASTRIDDIRGRLVLHTTAAQTILDGLTNRGVTRIEHKTDVTNAALSRIEQVLADIVKDIRHGSTRASVVSDEKWNIWTELKRELRIEGYPVAVVHQHKDQIKQYLLDLLQEAGLQEDVSLDEFETFDVDADKEEQQYLPDTKSQQPVDTVIEDIKFDSLTWFKDYRATFLVVSLFFTVAVVTILQSTMPYQLPSTKETFIRDLATPTSPQQAVPASTNQANSVITRIAVPTVNGDPSRVILELKAGLLKNEYAMQFTCGSLGEAQVWIDQLSPLFDREAVEESAIEIRSLIAQEPEYTSATLQPDDLATSPARPPSVSACPRRPQQLYGHAHYWDIYSAEPPWIQNDE